MIFGLFHSVCLEIALIIVNYKLRNESTESNAIPWAIYLNKGKLRQNFLRKTFLQFNLTFLYLPVLADDLYADDCRMDHFDTFYVMPKLWPFK